MFTQSISPVLLSLGPFEIRWYGLLYVIGFILAYYILKKISSLSEKKIEDLLVYSAVLGILCARLFYVLVYNLSYYIRNPFEVIAVWHGGLSIHGGIIGSLIGIWIFCNKNKLQFLHVLDVSVIPLALGIAIGRIGNIINGELYGPVTNVSWCVKFMTAEGCRHPWPLYESLYMLVIFVVLLKLNAKKLKTGMVSASFFLMYAFCRFFSEFWRVPDSQIGYLIGLTLGQWLNIAMFIIGLLFLYSIRGKK